MPVVDWALAGGLAALTVWSRLPFRARLLPTWDAVQFALALTDYDVVRHQPHPPGYILFVAAGRILAYVVGDGLGALTLLSVLTSAVAVGLLYHLAWRLYDRPTAVLAALVLLTSPLFWFHGVMPLSYTAEAALATAVASLSWALRDGRRWLLAVSALVLGLGGGVRQSILVVLFPLWLGAVWASSRRWASVLGALALLGGAVLVWLVPMLWLAGGIQRYVDAGLELYASTVRATTVLDPSGHWRRNAVGVGEALLVGLGFFLPLLLWTVSRHLWCRGLRFGPRGWLFIGWILPPLGVYTLVHLGQHGYLLTVLPACAILAARGVVLAAGIGLHGAVLSVGPSGSLTSEGAVGETEVRRGAEAPRSPWRGGPVRLAPRRWWGRRATVATLATAALAAHGAFFVFAQPIDVAFPPASAPWAAWLEAQVRGLYQFTLWAHTAAGLREREAVIQTFVEAVRTGFDPSETVLVTEVGNERSYPWFRHMAYYLPAFRVYQLRFGDLARSYLAAPTPVRGAPADLRRVILPASTRRLVWVVDYWNPAVPRPPGLGARPLAHGRWLYVLPIGQRPLEYAGYEIGRQTAVARPRRGGDAGASAGPSSRLRTGA